ncbi:hypothetical protein DVH26_06370 [Paenibacillus sp. H1-7]|uniref:hypothetical protein n=1 Tax=Paenibacillus sp. H1-7 TaxID=2282849 RepID=UPI001EF969E8|nr:hypothetical protein [Paenibacillus sp. H1-7]ULL14101.1 hypothetical protein DVH26_06370 [Paenibacillus sp. H1-7]
MKLIRYNAHVTPNREKMPGVISKYKLTGSDQINAASISAALANNDARIARQAGRPIITNVSTLVSIWTGLEYGLKKIITSHNTIEPIPDTRPVMEEKDFITHICLPIFDYRDIAYLL